MVIIWQEVEVVVEEEEDESWTSERWRRGGQ